MKFYQEVFQFGPPVRWLLMSAHSIIIRLRTEHFNYFYYCNDEIIVDYFHDAVGGAMPLKSWFSATNTEKRKKKVSDNRHARDVIVHTDIFQKKTPRLQFLSSVS